MRRHIGLVMAMALLGYGLLRIGVGSLLLLQSLDWISFAELASANADVKQFMDVRSGRELVAFTISGYSAYILAMGVLLTAGAVGVIRYQRSGFMLLGVYLVMHAALFINMQEINPKLLVLALQSIMLCGLFYLRPPKNGAAVAQ